MAPLERTRARAVATACARAPGRRGAAPADGGRELRRGALRGEGQGALEGWRVRRRRARRRPEGEGPGRQRAAAAAAAAAADVATTTTVPLSPDPDRFHLATTPTFFPNNVESVVNTRERANSERRGKLVREVTVQYNLRNEPWLKYRERGGGGSGI